MKYSMTLVSAFVAAAMAAEKPSFLNDAWTGVEEGKPYTLKYDNCESGCTIQLVSGPDSTHLTPFKVLTSSATGSSTTVTITGVPSGQIAFKITSNSDSSLNNYSSLFPYVGTGPAITSGSSSSSATGASSTGTDSASATATDSSTSSASKTTSTESKSKTTSHSSTEAPSSTESESSTKTSAKPSAATTKAPNSNDASGRLSSPIALVGGAVAAMLYLA